MGGDPRVSKSRGEVARLCRRYFSGSRHARASRAPALYPFAKLERSDGDKTLVSLAVELFAVAPMSLLAKGVKRHI
jgi:hypothetical protein